MKKKKTTQNKTSLIWKMAIASAVSWEVAKLVGSDHPYLAPLSVILCLQTTLDQSIRFSFHRIVGTAIGVLLTAYLVSHLHMNGWILGLLLLGGTYIAKWLRLHETVLHQVALTILLVFTFERKSEDYALDRIIDTIIGVIIAILVHMLIFPPDFTKKAAESFQKLAHQLSEILLELSQWVELEWEQGKGGILEGKTNNLLEELHTTKEMLQTASKSLKFNPISKKHRIILSRYQIEMQKMSAGYEYISNIVKTLKEWEKTGTLSSSDKLELGNDLKVLSKFFGNLEGIQQGVINNWIEDEQEKLLESLHSKMLLYPPPSHKVYRDFFYLETTELLKKL
ncbi:FUSC family protein [Oceanobacillus piezotolerans]|uniref:FUSC family protein n=1 Tax=Oceanobacillus piezotolerans TaxID=2448030 RepID=A0A498D3B9_9BACI|nr:FUSC family protein [Oceanobacillus piezotolerans]RLL41780.1 FUSC family protein [Oceanobacillus piezotolerans]